MRMPKVRNVLEYPDQTKVAGAKAALVGGGKIYRAVTDANGLWVLRVPGGEYHVTETVPTGESYVHTVTVPKGYLGTYDLYNLLT
jgi:hypothetical protein